MNGTKTYSADAVGARLRLMRVAFNLSQGQFARRAGVSASALANWEQGRQRPSLGNAELICDAYGVTLDYLFLGKIWTLRKDVADSIEEAARRVNSAPGEARQ